MFDPCLVIKSMINKYLYLSIKLKCILDLSYDAYVHSYAKTLGILT